MNANNKSEFAAASKQLLSAAKEIHEKATALGAEIAKRGGHGKNRRMGRMLHRINRLKKHSLENHLLAGRKAHTWEKEAAFA